MKRYRISFELVLDESTDPRMANASKVSSWVTDEILQNLEENEDMQEFSITEVDDDDTLTDDEIDIAIDSVLDHMVDVGFQTSVARRYVEDWTRQDYREWFGEGR